MDTSTVDIANVLETGLQSVQGDVMEIVGVALPIALAIVGVFVAVKLGIRFFKSVAK